MNKITSDVIVINSVIINSVINIVINSVIIKLVYQVGKFRCSF